MQRARVILILTMIGLLWLIGFMFIMSSSSSVQKDKAERIKKEHALNIETDSDKRIVIVPRIESYQSVSLQLDNPALWITCDDIMIVIKSSEVEHLTEQEAKLHLRFLIQTISKCFEDIIMIAKVK